MVVTIVGTENRDLAIAWCAKNLKVRDVFLKDIVPPDGPHGDWTYDFVFESESDAVWFALVHSEMLK